MTNIDRKKALESALSQIDKQFGKGSAMKYGDRPQLDIEVIPSGSLALDVALGVGGYPRGRIIEIYGPESSGKTTLTLHAIAEAQRAGLSCAFVDAEHAFDPAYAKNLHINLFNHPSNWLYTRYTLVTNKRKCTLSKPCK
jgi:recombination protein RecA